MQERLPRVLRYGIIMFVLFWVMIGQVTILLFIYQPIEARVAALPAFTQTQIILILLILTASLTVLGYYQFGSLAALAGQFSLWISEPEDKTVVEGRLQRDDFAWRVRYLDDGRIEVDHRECPLCGKEVIEQYLPSHVVLAPNTSFDPSDASRQAAADAWHEVTGKEKAEDRGETLALTCPDCNVAEPGKKEVLENRDAVESAFQDHIRQMQQGNPKQAPFKSYRERAQQKTAGEPTPAEIWDAYAEQTGADSVLPVQAIGLLAQGEQR